MRLTPRECASCDRVRRGAGATAASAVELHERIARAERAACCQPEASGGEECHERRCFYLSLIDLEARRALVVGGSGGLGSAMAAGLQQAGAHVAIIGRSSATHEVAARIDSRRRAVHGIRADATDRAALLAGFNEAIECLGGLDILIAAQGIALPRDVLEHDLVALGSNDRDEPDLGVRVLPARRACHGSSAPWQDHHDCFDAELLGWSQCRGVRGKQGAVAQLTRRLSTSWLR